MCLEEVQAHLDAASGVKSSRQESLSGQLGVGLHTELSTNKEQFLPTGALEYFLMWSTMPIGTDH